MNIPHAEQEQLSALQDWWQRYGKPVIWGGVLGLAGLIGYQWYDTDQIARAQRASALYLEIRAAKPGDASHVAKQGQLREQFATSPYATFVALDQAKQALIDGKPADAEASLRWALANTRNDLLRSIAQLQLARVLFDQGRTDEAKRLAEAEDAELLPLSYAELLGDIYVATGDRAGAKTAYEKAMSEPSVSAQRLRSYIQLKLDDLGADR